MANGAILGQTAPTPTAQEVSVQQSTAQQFGFSGISNVDQILQYLGQYTQYWWRRRTKNYSLGNTQSITTNSDFEIINSVSISGNSSVSASTTYYYSSEIGFVGDSIAFTGTKFSDSASYNSFSSVATNLRGNYFISITGKYWYAEENCSVKRTYTNGKSLVWVTPVQEVITNVGDWEYIYSSDRMAYPDSGDSGGYEYQYLGIPWENAKKTLKIVVGSYYGTGKYGVDSKNSLSFDSKPVFVIVTCANRVLIMNTSSTTGVTYSTTGTSDFEGTIVVSCEGNTVYWYSNNSAYVQQNDIFICNYIAFLV